MTIQAQLADGRILEFPDGTDPTVIQQTVKNMIGQAQPATQEVTDGDINNGVIGGDLGDPRTRLAPGAEVAATLVTGAIAEPIAGLAGIVQAINPFADPGAGARAVEATREALTFQPRTIAAERKLETVAAAVEPIAEVFTAAEEFAGDETFKKTGSPTLAAIAKTGPALAAEVTGLFVGKQLAKAGQKLKKSREKGKIISEIGDAAPSIDQLKDTARAVFKEIDDLGASLQPKAFRGMVNKLNITTKRLGIDRDVTPKAFKALERFNERLGDSPSLSDIDTMRSVAQNAARSLDPPEAALGAAMIETVDSFLDQLGPSAFRRTAGSTEDIGARYRTARDLWGRARRSELINEAFDRARNQASGFENGLRTQFRAILNNRRRSSFFRPDELAIMQRVVRGGRGENFARLVGRLGFSESGATNLIGGSLGIAGGAAVGGPVGAVIVPLVGQVSRKLAQRMTARNAEFADQVIRAGKDAEAITKAYLKNTPKKLRSSQELSELLMRNDIDLTALPDTELARQAAEIATQNRAALAAVLAKQQEEQQ